MSWLYLVESVGLEDDAITFFPAGYQVFLADDQPLLVFRLSAGRVQIEERA